MKRYTKEVHGKYITVKERMVDLFLEFTEAILIALVLYCGIVEMIVLLGRR
jgi:hypothetical protein